MIAYANEVVILNGGKNMSRVKSNGSCINPRETELFYYERHRSVIFNRGKISQTYSGLGSPNRHLLMSNMVTSSEKTRFGHRIRLCSIFDDRKEAINEQADEIAKRGM